MAEADYIIGWGDTEQGYMQRQTVALERIAAAQERIASATEAILAEAVKQSGYQLRIATSNECLCECCHWGAQRSEHLIQATMTKSEETALQRYLEYLRLEEGGE